MGQGRFRKVCDDLSSVNEKKGFIWSQKCSQRPAFSKGQMGGATLALTGALRQTRLLLLLLMLLHAPHVPAPFEWEWADQEDTQLDPWTPCDKWQADGTKIRGFCRLSCTTRWSFAPKRLDCRQLPADPLLRRSHSRGLERFQTMSQQSFSAVNSGQQADADA